MLWRSGSYKRARLTPGFWFSMPSYTAQMGHWSESLGDELARLIGGSPDRRLLTDALARAGREIDVLSGRSFHPLRRTTSAFEPNGLPLVDVPDLQVGSMETEAEVWEVPDPVNPQTATVLQLSSLAAPASRAAPSLRHFGMQACSSPRHRRRGAYQRTTSFIG